MDNITVKSAKAAFERYRNTYRTLSSMLDDPEQRKVLMNAIETVNIGENDEIYVKKVQLRLSLTGRVCMCYTVFCSNGVEVLADRIILKESGEMYAYDPEIAYQLRIPWVYRGSLKKGGILQNGTRISLCGPMDWDFITTTSAVFSKSALRWAADREEDEEQLEIWVTLEPFMPYNTYKELTITSSNDSSMEPTMEGEKEEDF